MNYDFILKYNPYFYIFNPPSLKKIKEKCSKCENNLSISKKLDVPSCITCKPENFYSFEEHLQEDILKLNENKTESKEFTQSKQQIESITLESGGVKYLEDLKQKYDLILTKYSCEKLFELPKNFDFFKTTSEVKKDISSQFKRNITVYNKYLGELGTLIEGINQTLKCKVDEYKGFKMDLKEIKSMYSELYFEISEKKFKSNFYVFLIDNEIEVYKIDSQSKELFVIKKKDLFSSLYLSSHLHITLEMEYKKFTLNLFPEKFSLLDFLINNFLMGRAYSIGYRPSFEKSYYYENKLYLNEYQPSDLDKNNFGEEYTLKEIETLLKDANNFPTIHKIFKHWVGDLETFYEDNITLFDKILSKNPESIYISMFNNKKGYFKTNFGTCDPFELKNLFEKKLKEYSKTQKEEINFYVSYLYKWFGYLLQNPTAKLPTGLAFYTEKGIGKDFAKDYILNFIFGSQNTISISQEILNEKHNGWMYGKRLCFANELSMEGSTINMHDRLKENMTNPTIAIRRMRLDAETLENFCHFLFFSNKPNMLKVEKNDRRFSIFRQSQKIPDITLYNICEGYLDKNNLPDNWVVELKEFYIFLRSLKVNYHEVKEPIHTEIKQTMQDSIKTDIEQFIDFCKESFENSLQMYIYFSKKLKDPTLINQYLKEEKGDLKLKIPELEFEIPSELLFSFFMTYKTTFNIRGNRTSNTFSRDLSSLGFSQTKPKWNKIEKKASRYWDLVEIFFKEKMLVKDYNYNLEEITLEVQ